VGSIEDQAYFALAAKFGNLIQAASVAAHADEQHRTGARSNARRDRLRIKAEVFIDVGEDRL
jgi:hypothetical protein